MARKKTGRRRGRPSLGRFAKRRQTTRRGRREGPDLGAEALRRRKRLLTGREDLPLDPAGVLLGRELIDQQQYSTLSLITKWLQRQARAWGGRDGSVNGLWSAIIAALTPTHGGPSLTVPPGGDSARYRLARALAKLDGCRTLVITLAEGRIIPPLIIRAVECRLNYDDEAELDRLREGLDRLAGRR